MDVVAAEIGLAEAIARPWTHERDPQGTLGLLADTERRVLAGAQAVAPLASEWIHQAALEQLDLQVRRLRRVRRREAGADGHEAWRPPQQRASSTPTRPQWHRTLDG
jgi:hypothetical protein